MKQAIQPGQITVPRRVHTGLGIRGILRCLGECVTAIQQLRDRRVYYEPGRSSSRGSHPFKATANGDATVDVAAGLMWTHRNNVTDGDLYEPTSLSSSFLESELATITATAGEGYAYLICDIMFVIEARDTAGGGAPILSSERHAYSGTPEIIYSETEPASYNPQTNSRNFAIPIAKIALADGIASVVTQYVKTDIFPIGGSITVEFVD